MNFFKKRLRWLIAVVCLIYICYFFYKNRADFSVALNLDFLKLFYIIALQLLGFLIISYRLKIVLEKCTDKNVRFFYWLRLYILGRFLNIIISQVGNIYRSIKLKKEHNISYTRYISSFASFTWLDTLLSLLMAGITIAAIEPLAKFGDYSATHVLSIFGASILLLPFIANLFLNKLHVENPRLNWVHSKIKEVLSVTLISIKDIKYISKVISLGILSFLRTCIAYYVYFKIFDLETSASAITLFSALAKLGNLLVITPGNIGIQELAFGFLSNQLGIDISTGILICAVGRAIGITIIIVLGVMSGGIDLLKHRKEYEKPATEDGPSET